MFNFFKKAWQRIINLECFEGTYHENNSTYGVDSFSPHKVGFLAEIERWVKGALLFIPMLYFMVGFGVWYIFSMIFPEWIRIPGLKEDGASSKKPRGFKKMIGPIFIASLLYSAGFGIYMLIKIVFNEVTLH